MPEIPGNITQVGQQAANLAGVAGSAAAGSYTVGDILQKKISEAYNYNQDIISKLDEFTQGYFSAPSEAREKYQNIFNPFSREKLISQYVGTQALPMLSQANVLGARMGGISDLVSSAVGGYQAQVAEKQALAQAKQQEYENMLNEFKINQELQATTTSEVTAGGRKYLVTYDKQGNIIKKIDMGSSTTGSGIGDLATALKLLGIIPSEAAVSNQQERPDISQAIEEPIQVDFSKYFSDMGGIGATGVAQPTYKEPAKPKYQLPPSFGDIFGY